MQIRALELLIKLEQKAFASGRMRSRQKKHYIQELRNCTDRQLLKKWLSLIHILTVTLDEGTSEESAASDTAAQEPSQEASIPVSYTHLDVYKRQQ